MISRLLPTRRSLSVLTGLGSLCLVATLIPAVALATTSTLPISGQTGVEPVGIALDSAGNVFTADYNGGSGTGISKILADGNIAPGWFTGSMSGPLSLSAGPNDLLFAPSASLDGIYRISPDGSSSTLWTSAGANPFAVAVDQDGNVYSSNNGTDSATKISPGGSVEWAANTGGQPWGITADDYGNAYVANYGGVAGVPGSVTKISAGGAPSTLGTTGSLPIGITVDWEGNVYTANQAGNNVTKLSPAGAVVWEADLSSSGFIEPFAIAIDSGGSLYVTDYPGNAVARVAPDGSVAWSTGTDLGPRSITVDSSASVYTGNESSQTVTKISNGGSESGILPAPPAKPSAPLATASVNSAAVTVAANPVSARFGAPTSYTVTAVEDPSKSCTIDVPATSCSVGSLTAGSSYTFTARAKLNAWTTGPSGPSNAVTVAAPTPSPSPPAGSSVSPPAPNTPPQPKVTLCHSGNGKNFTTITIAPEAAIDGHAKNHDDDIIPPFSYVKNGRTLQYAGQNWDAEGRAILNAGCQTPASNPANQVFNPPPPPSGKITLCHSGNGKNFTEITVAPQAALNGHAKNHSADIIPPFSSGRTSFPGQNWDATGRAIWSNGCSPPAPVTDPVEEPTTKVSLCHSAGGNRYVSIEVASAAALSGHSSQHAEDIIPPFSYKERGEQKTFPGQNWDEAGKAIFNNGCVPPAPPPTQPIAEPVTPYVSCVDVASDGSYTAYFGYRSEGIAPLNIASGSNNSLTSDASAAAISGPPTTFQPGAVESAATVRSIPAGSSATWSITSGSSTATTTANANSPACETEPQPVDLGLFAVCTERTSGGYSVVFGYQNDNVLPVSAPIGAGNRVQVNGAGAEDRGQPATLSGGRNANAFTVSGLKSTDTVAWEVTVGGLQRVATASIATPPCQTEPPTPPGPEPEPEPQNLEPVGPTVRCVARNSDGTYNVVFGYSNPNQVTVVAEGGAGNALSVSPGGPGPETRGQPTAFQPGNVGNAFTVSNVPAGQEITWTISSYGTRSVTAGIGFGSRCAGDNPERTPEPPPIDPEPEQQAIGVYLRCVDAGEDTYSATFGYVNPGSVALTIPAGALNGFGGSNPVRGQPAVFAPGDAPDAFRVTGIGINQRPTWRVVSPDGTVAEATANAAAPNCTTGEQDRGPETDVDPRTPPTPTPGPPKKPIITDIDNPGTEVDEKPKVTFELPGNVEASSVFDRNITCRRSGSGRKVTCVAARLLPGQVARVSIRVRCRRSGSGIIGVASVVRRLNLRPGQVASGSGTIRVKRCRPSYTG